MPFLLIRQDITKMQVDAIVNAANTSLLGGGGVDGAIHRAAGPRLLAKCMTLGGCKTGNAKITPGYNLPAKHIIHTVGPVYHDGQRGEPILIASCYSTSLRLAKEAGCETVAFPLISAGVYGYPRADAIRIAAETIRAFLTEHDDAMTVYLVIFDRDSLDAGRAQFPDIASYIDDRYADDHADTVSQRIIRANAAKAPQSKQKAPKKESAPNGSFAPMAPMPEYAARTEPIFVSDAMASLEDRLANPDESFSEMLLRKIDERGIKDSECYKRANIDRKTFSKIKCSKNYKPSKATVLSFAIALRLTPEETDHLLNTVGMSLSRSSKFDLIVEFFIKNGKYDIFEINETLLAFDQTLLGA
jgi:O-acetyl-ADP-ribose deacetylase (regulator of RNase III)